ncbi:hypothetical protein OGAPHI_001094 [Ogataea philodendri]|uniref:Uncharacterized protein n=1 Tax=Ogataea philodendri TaxID=1378263 RepID=A0A9P8T9G7_9ASCO|nr:uncharacterized protein OGAPHI_001094 [Ogataea philodendri]KAH3670579.1 hypothetical protein OGAPHI_001094 [Ogataea philodendri]
MATIFSTAPLANVSDLDLSPKCEQMAMYFLFELKGNSLVLTLVFLRSSMPKDDKDSIIAISVGFPKNFSFSTENLALLHRFPDSSMYLTSLSTLSGRCLLPSTARWLVFMSTVQALLTVMWFWVSVPVLSEQITLTEPSVSTLGNFLTMARCLAILKTPSASVTATIIGNPSGIAATAKQTLIWNMSSHERPSITPISPITPITAKLKKESCWPSLPMAFCNGVFGFSIEDSMENTLPSAVLWPVAITIPAPWPSRTSVPINAILDLSPMLGIGLDTTSRLFDTGLVSPVRLLSSMVR